MTHPRSTTSPSGGTLLRNGSDRLSHLGFGRSAAADQASLGVELVSAAAKICDQLIVLLLFDPSTGGLRAQQVRHRDDRRAEVLQARLTAELRGLPQPGELVLPAGARELPEPVRCVLTEEQPDRTGDYSGVLVVPVAGAIGPLGVLVLSRPGLPFSPDQADALVDLGQEYGRLLELARLAADSARASALMGALTDAVIAVDEAGLVTQWNSAAEEFYRISASDAIGARLHDLVRTVLGGIGTALADSRLRMHGSWEGRGRQRSRAGPELECDVRMVSLPAGGWVGVHRRVTASRPVRSSSPDRATASIHPAGPSATEDSFSRGLIEALHSPAALIDTSGRVLEANAGWLAAVVQAPRDGCGPVPLGASWTAMLRSSPALESGSLAASVESLLAAGTGTLTTECYCAAADHVPSMISVVSTGADALVIIQPPDGAEAGPGDLTHRATHDELTGLPNRGKLMDDLSSSLNRLDGSSKLAVLFCDLDGFKDINDGLGHDVGDQVLIAVAKRLRQRCRSADVVARFGGDEFVVVLSINDAAQAIAMADRIVEVLAEPIVVGSAEVAPGVSVGITVVDAPPDEENPVGTLLRDADTAMYHAKGRGRGRYEVFDASLRENIEERLELAAALHRAVADDQLEIVYQSRRQCGDRKVAGVEAMLRWRHPTLGLLGPDTFIPIAERTGKIVELGDWVLQHSLAELAALDDQRITLAVNVSPRQLAAGRLARTVAQHLATTGVDPSRLTLEITENAFVDDPKVARDVLTDLQDLGVSIALDDFGTGWSSLQYLRTLPVDVLKIDRSFVADLPTDLDACAVVAAVLQLGHGMGLVVVAEGVENHDHLSMLRDMGCDEYQGFIDGRPGPLAAVLRPAEPDVPTGR